MDGVQISHRPPPKKNPKIAKYSPYKFVPAEALGETGGGVRGGGDGGLGGPIVVRRVSGRTRRRGVERVLRREGAELGAEPGDLAEVGGVDEVALSLSPLGSAILEPNLQNSDMFIFVKTISALR